MENQHLLNKDKDYLQKSISDRKFVIFDLDGTLIDSFECVLRCVNKALDTFSLPHVEIPLSYRHGDIAIIFDKAKEITVESINFSDFKKRFDEIHLNDYVESVYLIESTYKKLVKYHQDGVKILILTNKYQPIAEKICQIFLPCVDAVVIGRTFSHLSDSKLINLIQFCKINMISEDEIIYYFGDTVKDKYLAEKLNIPYCHV